MKSKILIYDVETTPLISYTWGTYQQNVIEVIEESHLLCFAYKWFGDKKVQTVALPDFVDYKKDPKNDVHVVKALHKLFSLADMVVAHNGNRFDQKVGHARMLTHNLPPPTPYQQIDTLTIARRYFKFDSNKLDVLGERLGVGRKVATGGFSLWKGCMEGDPKSWKKMLKYNKQDVQLLEDVYVKLRPWVNNHPTVASEMQGNTHSCPKCGHNKLWSKGIRRTKVNSYRRYQCQKCLGWSHQRTSLDTEKPEIVN